MGGKSRKTGSVSKALIQRIKAQKGEKCGTGKLKTSTNNNNLGLMKNGKVSENIREQ